MVDVKKFSEKDLYGLIGIDCTATENEIRKAYRKKALQCHPDKNPDNPKAAELFQELSKALEILTDISARAAYNKILNAKKATELRNKQLDSKRFKLKTELEEREKAASLKLNKPHSYNIVKKTDEEILQAEIERLRNEGSKLLEEEQELMKKQLQEERLKAQNHYDSSQHRIKIKWKDQTDPNLNYTEDSLRNFLKKYGDIIALVMSPKKGGSALVEFNTQEAGEMAVNYEKGNMSNPLHLEWIGQPPKQKGISLSSETIKESDFESLVLRKMRQAEERKRLIEQMIKEDDES